MLYRFKTKHFIGGLLCALLLYFCIGRLHAYMGAVSTAELTAFEAAAFNGSLHIATYNIAHGRGPVYGQTNWSGSAHDKTQRLQAIGRYLAESNVDVAVLNEVDFNAFWSDGVDQATVVAKAGGFRFIAKQINYKVNIPFASLAFGNAIVSRYPINASQRVMLPAFKAYEALLYGNHDALQSQIDLGADALSVWAIHLEYRDEATRIAALNTIAMQGGDQAVLAGDFNSRPSASGNTTALDQLLARSAVTTVPNRNGQEFTFPTHKPDRAIDWIILPPQWRLQSAWVGTFDQSDHLPVHAVLQLSEDPSLLQ